jgi:hypothetical protein
MSGVLLFETNKDSNMWIWKNIQVLALPLAMVIAAGAAQAQTQTQAVAYSPGAMYDKLAWTAFVTAVKPSIFNTQEPVTFQTWATDVMTFNCPVQPPTWQACVVQANANGSSSKFQTSMLSLAHQPGGLSTASTSLPPGSPCQPPPVYPSGTLSGNFPTPYIASPPTNCIAEEVRRNRASFDYIAGNNLYSQAGLRNAFSGPAITFPKEAIELKMDWVPVPTVVQWLIKNGVPATPAFVRQNYFITTQPAPDNTQYALTSMHISTKELPDWLWATFEHRLNPGRCDTMGCYDQFGVLPVQASVPPRNPPDQQYGPCIKSPQLLQMFINNGIQVNPWQNYCLKATQIDFVSTQTASTGQPVLDGDSVVEGILANVPIAQSSCITCHAYAAFNSQGQICIQNSGLAGNPIGAYSPQTGQKQYDFVWGLLAATGFADCLKP